ncbi:MAG: isochorismatase hydrolase [Acidobacteriales bacterium]|nr:isochorismatase hydrolase [Terriglobales bacterium]
MFALIVVDAQNEFSPEGMRAVPNHTSALSRIQFRVREAREHKFPIAWVQHHNRPNESPAFVPGTWGAELSAGLGVQPGYREKLFVKDVFGAFTNTGLEQWLRSMGVTSVLIVGFFAHMCVSTSAREALVRDFDVHVDPAATGAQALQNDALGSQTADEVVRTAMLHLKNMGVELATSGSLPGVLAAV